MPKTCCRRRAQDRLHFPRDLVRQARAADLEHFEAGQLLRAGFLLVLDPPLGDGGDRR